MLGRKEWRIRTPFNEVLVRLSSFGAKGESGAEDRALLSELMFEFQNLNPEVVGPLLEIHQALSGIGGIAARSQLPPALSHQLRQSIERDLRSALGGGRLRVEPPARSKLVARRRVSDVVRLGPEAIVEEVTTFIGIRVLDDQGKPVQGERVRLEFADGSVRNLRTGADGTIFVDGLDPGGPATVTLTDRNEPGDAEGPVPADTFEAQFVDETGQGIDGIEVVFSHASQDESQITDADGVAKVTSLEEVQVRVAALSAVREVLSARWVEPRTPNIPDGDDVQVFDLRNTPDNVSLRAGARSTIVLTPPMGTLRAELWDKTGRVPHANRDYTIDGAMQFSGTTDEQGRLFHDHVLPGDYKLTLTVELFEGEDRVSDTYEAPLVVQGP